MADDTEKNLQNTETKSPWYRCAINCSIIGVIFSLIVLVFITSYFVKGTISDTKQEAQLENLKTELRLQPDNQQLVSQIRQLDLQRRRYRIQRLDFSHKGGYLLFGGVAVSLTAFLIACAFRKKTPHLFENKPNEQLGQAVKSRLALATGLLVVGCAALLMMMGPSVDFGLMGSESTSYPSVEEINRNWPCFRGPGGLGIAADANMPTEWNGKTGQGILWKAKVPLRGNSSPVVWNDRVFLSGGDPNGLQVFCFNADSGELLWSKDVRSEVLENKEEPFEAQEYTGFASPTVVTDGRRVYAIFATGDIACFNFDGKQIWSKNLGVPDSAYGYASSLAMYRNLVLIQYDQGSFDNSNSKLIALDGFSGQLVWETTRPVPNSWSSPTVTDINGRFQLLTCGVPWVIAYDPADGTELWRADCLGGDIASSPIYANGLVFAIEAYSKLVAIRPDGQGDVTKTHIAWIIEEGMPDICSPVSNGELIFPLTSEGLLFCFQTSDGKKLWEKDLRDYFQASPTLAGNNIYLISEEGVMFIIEAGPEYKQLNKCELGESCHSSPAFMNGRIYIRGMENLYCIGKANSE